MRTSAFVVFGLLTLLSIRNLAAESTTRASLAEPEGIVTDRPSALSDKTVASLLNDVLLFSASMSVQSPGAELWHYDVEKVTVLGRKVDFKLKSGTSRLTVGLTLYPAEGDTLLLVARCETWLNGKYSNSLSSIPVDYQEEIYYYPLGRAVNAEEGNSGTEVLFVVKVENYMKALGQKDRKALLLAFESSSTFNLAGD